MNKYTVSNGLNGHETSRICEANRRMRSWLLLTAGGLIFFSVSARAAGSFECPVKAVANAPSGGVMKTLPVDGTVDQAAAIKGAIGTLRTQGMSPGSIVDNLIIAYCPYIASQPGLSDADKASRVARLAAYIAGQVYSPSATDQVVLSASFSPAEVSAINAHARSLGISPETWIQGVVAAALQ